MKEKDNKELIDRMADVLRGHSAPYREGAWERFAGLQKRARKVIPLWYLGGAAAAVLLGVVFFVNRNTIDKPITPSIDYTQNNKLEDHRRDTMSEQTAPAITEQNNRDRDKPRQQNNDNLLAQLSTDETEIKKDGPLTKVFNGEQLRKTDNHTEQFKDRENEALSANRRVKEEQASDLPQEEQTPKAANKTTKDREEALISMLSENNSSSNSSERALMNHTDYSGDKRWNVGVMFAPSLTDERFNMGGGVTVAYKISKKVSIGSGVSLVDLGFRQSSPGASSDGPMNSPASASLSDASPTLNAKSLETKELTSVNTNLLALDIPIDIKYQVSKQFYASAGISFFAVLNEDRTNNFLTRTPTNRTIQNTEGYAFSQPEFQINNVSEKAEETPLQGNGYSGFLNFSVGRKMPISRKVGIAVEPFFKIPIGSLSNQNMNLRYGGVRVITSF
ncbi:hypothetical protein RYH73_15185 [Olivibacter sp. CPCC 100613]|uniref:hypothetical protein n=1 Tax=Olivibacter sp. CPCC 100613 TaxID=3079931 RepID=UPI002FF6EB3D